MRNFPSYFFLGIWWVKTGKVEVNRYEKWYKRWLRLLYMLFLGLIYIVRGPWHLKDFCNVFLPNISKDQEKFYYLSVGLWHCAIWQIRRRLLHYVFCITLQPKDPGAPWLLVRGPGAPWLSVRGPGAPWLSVRCPGVLWLSVRGPKALWLLFRGPGAP